MSPVNRPLDAFRREVLKEEKGRLFSPAENRFLLGYPGGYREAMSSLGFLSILRLIDETPGWCAERAVLERDVPGPLRSLETDRLVLDYSVIGLSVGYELQLGEVVDFLQSCGLSPLAETRAEERKKSVRSHPLVVAGGPLTRINPRPLGAFVDICVVGDGEGALERLLGFLAENPSSGVDEVIVQVSGWDGFYVPAVHGDETPAAVNAATEDLPAWAPIRTEKAEFGEMFLVEACRGCSMNCRFCVIQRELSKGARFVSAENILELIPDGVKRVGLVGAAVGYHPELGKLLHALADRGLGVGLSSVRADRLDEEIAAGLARVELKTLTVAADGASQRIRNELRKGVSESDLRNAAALAAEHGLKKLKVYQLVGVPGETDRDWEEMGDLASELSGRIPVELSFSCFVPKPGTPLALETPVAPARIRAGMKALKRRLTGKAGIKEPALRWLEVEWRLSHGTIETGRVLYESLKNGKDVSRLKRDLRESSERNTFYPSR